MLRDKTFLAVVPARGGSKRLPNKNIKELGGLPLVSWSIDAAKQSRYVDSVVVTSDDLSILSIATKENVNVIKRPTHLAGDKSKTVDVLLHALEKTPDSFDYLILLQPTSPLRKAEHIDQAIEMMFEIGAESVVSVCESEHSPMWSNVLPNNGSMKDFVRPEQVNVRSQDLDQYY